MQPTPPGRPPRRSKSTNLARRWAEAIRGTSYVPLNRRELRDYLDDLTAWLSQAVRASELDVATIREVGAAMVGAHFTGLESLERTLQVLGEELTTSTEPLLRDRSLPVLSAFATGFAEALRTRTLSEQQGITMAAIMAQRDAEDARWASENRFGALFADAAIGISVGTVNGQILEVNRAMCDMFGYTPDEFIQHGVTEFVHPGDAAGTWDAYAELTNGVRDHIRMEKPYYRSDGTMIWTDLVVSLIRDQDGTPEYMVAMMVDTTESHELHDRLRHQATHDPLTGLPNRALFFEQLDTVLTNDRGGDRVGLCYLGLDGYKAINDTLGHDVGDGLLKTIGDRLARQLGDQHLVARLGGDEFVVLVDPSTGADELIRLAQLALAVIREPIDIGTRTIVVSASVGVVEAEVAHSTTAELMKAADTTLYWAKSEGRNRWALFDPQRHAREIVRYELSTSLPAALDQHELFLEYQPLVSFDDETLTGVEALVRWNHPTLGRLGPDEFISLAEATGLISSLGSWVLRSACLQARTWRDKFPDRPLLVSVNLAAHQVKDPTIVAEVAGLLAEAGIDPANLQLEITESEIMATAGQPLQTLHELSGLGVRIAIDDFGTGYSNLAYLRSLPIDSLKLAGPFVTSLRGDPETDSQDRAIVGTLISLAHTLGLTVTAEGVETEDQVQALRALGCDTAQGYHYAQPGPADAIDAWLASER
ncbi:MAG TPA: EAL domain-containing protein [Micromonosporaceae bacterium]